MKKLLIIFLTPIICLFSCSSSKDGLIPEESPHIYINQPENSITYIPDANFEQHLIDLGYDNHLNGNVYTSSIDTITYLKLQPTYNDTIVNELSKISDLTGIENFSALTELYCSNSNLTELYLSRNTALTNLECFNNKLTIIDIRNNTALTYLYCFGNQITSLDVSGATSLERLLCDNNQLVSLDLRNGNNINMLATWNNPNLSCINVDNSAWSTTNWTDIDPQHYFSNNCP
tara:strand:+ start:33 stop:728 length:696 start_codon:yes stop_codon:yes gene_type:complete